ncbi:MAG: hypothetical protein RSE02_03930 [Bacteroidales bacterium]
MKKKLICFMTIAASLILSLGSCSKDATPAEDIAREYTKTDLAVTNAGVEIPSGSLKITAIDNTNAELVLTNIVNGNPQFTMSAVIMETETGYSFVSAKDVDGMKVKLEGAVVGTKATINVGVEITSAEILKSWVYATKPSEWFGDDVDALVLGIENKSGLIYSTLENKKVPAAQFSASVAGFANVAILGGYFSDLVFTFAPNGYVGVSVTNPFAPTGSQKVNIPQLARYYYNPTTKVLLFDAPLAGLVSGKANQPTPALSGTIQVPFNCKFENGQLTAVVDYNFIKQFIGIIPEGKDLETLLGKLDALVPEGLKPFLPTMKILISDIVVAVKDPDLTNLTLGGKLIPKK